MSWGGFPVLWDGFPVLWDEFPVLRSGFSVLWDGFPVQWYRSDSGKVYTTCLYLRARIILI